MNVVLLTHRPDYASIEEAAKDGGLCISVFDAFEYPHEVKRVVERTLEHTMDHIGVELKYLVTIQKPEGT